MDAISEKEILLLEQGSYDGLLVYSLNVDGGIEGLKNLLNQSLSTRDGIYTTLQQQSVSTCCQVLRRSTMEFSKAVFPLEFHDFISREFKNDLMSTLPINTVRN